MVIVLSGDIGGTKTILRLTRTDISPAHSASTLFQQQYPSADFDDLVPMVRQFINQASDHLSQDFSHLPAACFGIAGPVVDRSSNLTNLGWTLAADRLQAELDIPVVELVNDFAAIGYGVTALNESDIYTLQAGEPVERGPIAVLGAGTGLGEAYLTWQGNGYQVYATEGGHTSFAPRTEQQDRLLEYLLLQHDRVSVERVVSGRGIVSIYQFLRDSGGQESAEVAAAVRQWEQEGSPDAGAVIGRAAVERSDALSVGNLKDLCGYLRGGGRGFCPEDFTDGRFVCGRGHCSENSAADPAGGVYACLLRQGALAVGVGPHSRAGGAQS